MDAGEDKTQGEIPPAKKNVLLRVSALFGGAAALIVAINTIDESGTKLFKRANQVKREVTREISARNIDPNGPPPPLTEQDPRQYVVYFPFNSWAITPEAEEVINMAVDQAKRTNADVLIVGNDGACDGADQQKAEDIARRKAMTVKNSLLLSGIKKDKISESWRLNPSTITLEKGVECLKITSTVEILVTPES